MSLARESTNESNGWTSQREATRDDERGDVYLVAPKPHIGRSDFLFVICVFLGGQILDLEHVINLHDLDRGAGWGRKHLHDITAVSWVRSVLHRSLTTYHDDLYSM